MPAIFFWLVAMVALLVISGLVMLVIGWRGRRIDDHALCRHCGFDLTGRPEDSERCAECGSDLHQPSAIAVGHRRRRKGWVIAGAGVIVVPVLLLGAIIYQKINVYAFMPMPVLSWCAQGSPGPTVDSALDEMNRRLANLKLSDEQIDSVCTVALKVQGNRSLPWNSRWGDFVEFAHNSLHKISDEHWKQYAEQAPDFQIAFRAKVRRGDLLAYRSKEGPSRVGGKAYPLIAGCENGVITINGEEIRDPDVVRRVQLQPRRWGIEGGGSFDLTPILAKLEDGQQRVKISCDVVVYDSYSSRNPLAKRHYELTGGFELTPSAESTLSLIKDETFRNAVERGLTIKISVKQDDLYVEPAFKNIPVPLSYSMIIMDHGKERTIGAFTWRPASRILSYGMSSRLEPFPPPMVDVIFRPNHKIPLGTIDMFDMWDGEVVIRNVPIVLPATKPSAK